MIKDLLNSFAENRDRRAFCINDTYYTYGELQSHVIMIQRQIDDLLDGGSNKNIAVVCSNDIRTYAALLAIWFSNCAYVPLGLHNPVDRNLSILESAEADIIIVAGVEFDDPRYSPFRIIRPVQPSLVMDEKIRCSEITDHTLAYILFTSGSTGSPKGVPISHGNLSAFIKAFSSSPFRIG